MRSLHTPMTPEEFERMPRRFGWKYEYYGGLAHAKPRETHVHVRLPVGPRAAAAVPPPLALRTAGSGDAEALIDCFFEAFAEGIEFCDRTAEDVRARARDNILDYFAGRRGEPSAASRLVTTPGGTAVAAALFTLKPDAPVLDLLMTRPGHRRRGLSNALVTAALGDLRAQGYETLRSAFAVANDESAAWHHAFGFVEEPDLHVARLRREHYLHEAGRHESLTGGAGRAAFARLNAEYEFWRARVDELEEIAGREGYEAVSPALRYD